MCGVQKVFTILVFHAMLTWLDHVQQMYHQALERAAPTFSTEVPNPFEVYRLTNGIEPNANFYVFQFVYHAKAPEDLFEFDVMYTPVESEHSVLPSFPKDAFLQHALEFEKRFENTFNLASKGFSPDAINVGQAALSNMLGGIGYFHGTAIVDHTVSDASDYVPEGLEFVDKTPNPQHTPPMSLFTATPSRPVFPRGFLWDEGFHQMLIGQWDVEMSLDMMNYWFSLVDEDGWLPREQILGAEARSKVPPEFQIQIPSYANPPTLFLALAANLERLQQKPFTVKQLVFQPSEAEMEGHTIAHVNVEIDSERLHIYLQEMYPAMRRMWIWFRTTQRGNMKLWGRNRRRNQEAYRWRGRTIGHTLTSGLDDYPRGSPHVGELHLDLLCWMASMTQTMKLVADRLGEEDDAFEYEEVYENMVENIEKVHWDDTENMFCDLSIDEDGIVQNDSLC